MPCSTTTAAAGALATALGNTALGNTALAALAVAAAALAAAAPSTSLGGRRAR